MFAQWVSWLCIASVIAGFAVVAVPASASAAAPACAVGPFLYQLPAGSSWTTSRLPCTTPTATR